MKSLTSGEFKEVYSLGRRFRAKFFTLVCLAKEPAGFGISVSKKVGSAVIRNKLKRRIKEILKKAIFSSSGKIVLIPSPASAGLSFGELYSELNILMRKANLVS